MIPWYELKMTFNDDGDPISGEIVFSHVDPKERVMRHFAIERIVTLVENMPVRPDIIEFPIDPMFARYAAIHRGVEPHRLARITPQDIAHYPIMLAHFPGIGRDTGEHLIIDGHHRYVRAAMLGWSTLRGYVLPQSLWEQYLVDVPEELLKNGVDDLLNQHNNPIDSHIR